MRHRHATRELLRITVTLTEERDGAWTAVVDDPRHVQARRYQRRDLERLLTVVAEGIAR